MNEAQLYEGLFSWLAFYTFSNFGPGEIRQNMGEIWGPRAKARLEGTTRPTILIICLEKISVSPDLLPPFCFHSHSLLWVGNLYLLFSAFKSLYILRRGNLTPPGPASSSSSTLSCLMLRKDWFAWRLTDVVEVEVEVEVDRWG